MHKSSQRASSQQFWARLALLTQSFAGKTLSNLDWNVDAGSSILIPWEHLSHSSSTPTTLYLRLQEFSSLQDQVVSQEGCSFGHQHGSESVVLKPQPSELQRSDNYRPSALDIPSSSTCVDVPPLNIYAAAHPFHPFLCDFFCKRPFPTFHFLLFPTHCFENSCLLQRLPEACRNEVPRLFKASIPIKQQFKLSSLYNSINYFTTLTM